MQERSNRKSERPDQAIAPRKLSSESIVPLSSVTVVDCKYTIRIQIVSVSSLNLDHDLWITRQNFNVSRVGEKRQSLRINF